MNDQNELVKLLHEPDEKGFVFLSEYGGACRPRLCRKWGDKIWLFYWHADGHWVSLREVDIYEWIHFPRNLTKEQQQQYHDAHDSWTAQFELITIIGEVNEPGNV